MSKDDTEAEILFEKEQPEQREIPRVVFKDNPAPKVEEDSVRKERTSMMLKPVIDQRSCGISKQAVEQDQDRQALISMLVKQVMGLSGEKEQ